MKPSGIITLTSDFGLSDPYVGMMKGVILSIHPAARLVDISHKIGVGAIFQAALLIHEAFPYFPKGTVHLAVVDPGVGSERRLVAVEAGGHLFVGPDNGIFWPVIKDDRASKVVQLTESWYFLPPVSRTFHGRDIFAPVAAHLSLGLDLEKLGPPVKDPFQLNVPRSSRSEDLLFGQIIRVDNFGNLITNIQEKELKDFLQSDPPHIEVENLTIMKINRTYAESDEGAPLALINSSRLLEIGVNMGRASEYLGVDPGEIVGTIVKVKRGKTSLQ